MSEKPEDFTIILRHIINSPNIEYKGRLFRLGDHFIEYGTTKLSSTAKEHKFWTPRKSFGYRCYMIIQKVETVLRIHHVLNSADGSSMIKELLHKSSSITDTFASRHGSQDQFKALIEIEIQTENKSYEWLNAVYDYLLYITNSVIQQKLNLSDRAKGKRNSKKWV